MKQSSRAGTRGRRKAKKDIPRGVAHIQATFNNTIVTITDMQGNVVSWSSAGAMGFKGSRKATPFAASQVAGALARDMKALRVKTVEVNLRGPGSGRDSVVRSFQAAGLSI